MIEVLKTNVENTEQAKLVISMIVSYYPHFKVNFDLEDCDKILRIDSGNTSVDGLFIAKLLSSLGFKASILSEDELNLIPQVYGK